jgi:branched-chain amino acid aminotransferase
MSESLAYLNGEWLPASRVSVSVTDGGFVQGTTVAEQLRTFNGQLFRLEAHVDRLLHSLAIVEIDSGLTRGQWLDAARELATRNHALLAAGDDLGLVMFVTPGDYGPMTAHVPTRPMICLHTFPLRFALWGPLYQSGQPLATTDVAQVSPHCWPRELKCRSRMHYYLADRQARRRDPASRALMVDEDGLVTETTTANVVAYRRDLGLLTPPHEKILPGISLAVLLELAAKLGMPHVERDLTPEDVAACDEVFLTATSSCVLAVSRLNGRPIGAGQPGPMYDRFLAAWSELVGIDIAGQARQFAVR